MAATVLPTFVRGTLRSFGSGEGNSHSQEHKTAQIDGWHQQWKGTISEYHTKQDLLYGHGQKLTMKNQTQQ